MKYPLLFAILVLFSCCFFGETQAQVQLQVRIDNGNSNTTCTDGFFGGAPDPQWRVNIENQGWDTYPRSGACFNNFPRVQYSETFNCTNRYPAQIEVCFRAFEDDGGACIVSESCRETVCQNFATPAPGASISYSLSVNGSSSGTVNFTIIATGGFNLPGGAYNTICNAVNLGTLNPTSTIGNRGLSNYGNFCADNVGEPNPWGGDNDQGVWFQFTTSATPAAVIELEAQSDPQNLGNDIDLQLALYQSSNGACNGTLTLVEEAYNGVGLFNDEDMSVNCLQPNTTYFLLVDGENTNIINTDGQEGYFGVEIRDGGILQAADLICDAEFLGLVPNGGSVGTPNLSRSNICASNTNDPTPGAWASDKTVWFSFQAPPSGHVIVNADSDLPWPLGTDAVDLQLAVYSSSNSTCTGTLTNLASDYTPGLFDEDLEVRCLTSGETYWVMVDGSGLNVDGIFDIEVRDGGIFPAPNDLICDAIALGAPAPNATVGLNNQNNYCADNLFEPIPSAWGNDQGVWYTFIAPPSGKVEVRLDNQGLFSSDNIDLQAAVYDLAGMVCSGLPSEINSQHQGIGVLWDETMEVECLIPGREYWVLVDGEGSLIDPDLQVGIFDIEVWADPRDPAGLNDLPCNAIALGDPTGGSVGTTRGPQHGSQNNFCATAAGEPQPSQFTADQTVWYTFVAPSTGNVELRLEGDPVLSGGVDPINLQAAIYEAPSCNGPFREHISGDDLVYDLTMDVFCLKPGVTYYVQVDGADPRILEGHEGYFDITITETPATILATNDDICNAVALGNPWAGAISLPNQQNFCADNIGDPTPTAFNPAQTVWYTFTTPATGGPFAVEIDGNSSLPFPFGNQDAIDLQMAVYSSSNNLCTGTLTEVKSEYDLIDLFDETMLVQCLEENRTYYLMVNGSGLDRQGYFDLTLTQSASVPIPTNNMICQHENLGTVPIGGSINNGVSYFNYCADTEAGEPSPFGIEQTVWFSFVAPNHTGPNATADVTIKVESDPANIGDNVDLQLAVYESSNNLCTGNMSLIEDGDDDPLLSFDAEVNVTCLYPGRRYWVQVDGTILNNEGYFQIEIEDDGSGIRPPYNIICNAVSLGTVPNGGQINNGVDYTNLCSDTEPGEPNPTAFSTENTVWFTFTAPASGNVEIDAFSDPNNLGDDVDLELALYYSTNNACTGTFLEVDSDYDAFNRDEGLDVDCLEAGRVYWLQVDGNDGTFGDEDGYFTLRIRDDGGTSNFPYNNDICDAYNFGTPAATQTLTSESNVCANIEVNEPGLGGYATHTVWYQFTAPTSGRVEIDVVSTNLFLGLDPEVRLFSSNNNSCTGSLSRMETSDWPTALIPENIEANCLIPGDTYFIQVDGSGLTLEGTFDISIRDRFPNYGTGLAGDPQPTNNYCDSAIALTVQASSCLNANGTFQTYNYGYPTITYDPAFGSGCNGNCGDTWYQFTMPASGNAVIEGNDDGVGGGVLGDFSDLTVAAYSGNCNNLTPIDCDQGGLTDDVSIQIAAAPGSTVWLQVFNEDGDDENEDYQICVSEGCGYDDCLTALTLPIQSNIPYCFNTAGATGENIPSDPGYNECSEGDDPENSVYYYFVSDCNGSDVTLSVINAIVNGNCILGITPSDGFNISLFQDATPCDGNPDTLVDCQQFTACDVQPINWSQTYTGLRPNTPYVIQIDGGFGSLGGDNSGEIMITTTTNPVVNVTSTPVGCSGINNGTATPIVQGGVGPFTFQWNTGQTDSVITGLAPGNYYVTATGANGCFDSSSVTVDPGVILIANIASTTDVSCSGDCDGQATAIGVGGFVTLNYTYQWDIAAGSQTTSTATGLCIGTYDVTVSDDNGCSDVATATITTPNPIVSVIDSTRDATCNGICDGAGYVSASGGTTTTGSYNYTWPGGQATPGVTGLCAGSYLVSITDANGCLDTIRVDINTPLGLTATIANQTDIDCGGDSTGSVEILAQNGVPNYTYTLFNNSGQLQSGSANTFTNLWADDYGILVQDANGCQDSVTITIATPNPLSLNLVATTNASCNGSTDGSIVTQAVGGTAPYTYSIDGINFFADSAFSNLAANGYIITTRDANNCTAQIAVTLTEPLPIATTLNSQTVASCGICDGQANITVSGGAGGFTYLWTSGETTQNATGLCAGSNTVTVTDLNSCTTTLAVNIINSNNFGVTTNIDQVISCNGDCNGAISVTPLAAVTPSYIWNNGVTTNALTNLCTGNYSVTVTDASGCFVVENFNLTEPATLTTLAAQTQGVSCNGLSDGQATATPTGGTTPYSYIWDNGETNAIATALNAGTHAITVTDANGCFATASTTITEPTTLTIGLTNIQSSNCGTTGCDGQATVSVNGGQSPYSYSWSGGQTTAAPTDLCPNFNEVTVTDANGCTATTNVNIPANSNLNLVLITSSTPSCVGDCDGNAIVSASGGNTTVPYTFNWDVGQTNANATGLCAGDYFVTATDNDGCSAAIMVTIVDPDSLNVLATTVTNPSCSYSTDGQVGVITTGGTNPVNYSWDNGQNIASPASLGGGLHIVTATDANGCTDTSSVFLTTPTPLSSSVSVTSNYNGAQISCADGDDGTAQVTTTGGTGNYTYLWVNGETTANVTGLQASYYPVTITDANGCIDTTGVTLNHPPQLVITTTITSNYNGFDVSCADGNDGTVQVSTTGGTGAVSYLWSDGQNTTTAINMNAGTYAVTATDANGCFTMDTDSLTAPPALVDTILVNQIINCSGDSSGQLDIVVTGGLTPYQYNWSNGATAASATGLPSGNYSVTTTDLNGCTSTEQIGLNEPNALTAFATTTDATCYGNSDGMAQITIAGATPPYQFLWSDGQTTQNADSLAAGNYTLSITDANGCLDTLNITINQLDSISITTQVFDTISCNGASDGSAVASATGGAGFGYQYQWSNGQTTAQATGLSATTYLVTVTDVSGCTNISNISLVNPASVQATASIVSNYNGNAISCFGATDGSATVMASGGNAPYTYAWANGQTTATATGLGHGNHLVNVTDANGCTDTSLVNLVQPTPISLTTAIDQNVTCNGGSDGRALATAIGGTAPYSYLWADGTPTSANTTLAAGNHTVTVTDANGCSAISNVTIIAPFPIFLDSMASTIATCHGANNGTLTVLAGGGAGGYTYNWSNGQTANRAIGLVAGTYDVTITDIAGCSAVFQQIVTQPAPLQVGFSNIMDLDCYDANNGSATPIPSGGIAPYRYIWNGNANNQATVPNNLIAGYNQVMLIDTNNCFIIDSVFIDSPSELVISPTQSNVGCFGDSTGVAGLNPSGGVPPYTYSWSDGTTNNQIQNLVAGTVYTGVVLDSNGCSASATITITQPNALGAAFTQVTNIACAGQNTGSITAAVNNSTNASYGFFWSNNTIQSSGNSATIGGLSAGAYSVTITDTAGCSTVLDTIIMGADQLQATAIGSRLKCFGDTDGSISIQATGGQPPYSYYRKDNNGNSIGQQSSTFSNLRGGTYTVGVVDANGCTFERRATVIETDSVVLETSPDVSLSFGQQTHLYVRMPVNSPTNPVVTWTPSTGLNCTDCYQPVAQPFETTLYTVTITGDEGCTSVAQVLVEVDETKGTFVPDAFSPNGDGVNDVFMLYADGTVETIEEFMIFDRWGELVCNQPDGLPNYPAYGWDGTFKGQEMNSGVYIYYIKVRYLNGEVGIFKGDLTLLK